MADRTRSGQRGHVVGQQFIHQRLVAGTEVIERVVVHRHAATDPSIGIVLLAQPRHFTPAAHAIERCVQPQRKQDVRVDRRTPGTAAACLDRIEQAAHVLVYDVAPHQPRPMVLCQQRLQIRCPQLDLRTVRLAQPRRALASLAGRGQLPLAQLR